MESPNRKTAGIILLLMIAVFVLPFIFAWFLYTHPEDLYKKTTNYGKLISPPFLLSNLEIVAMRPSTSNPLRVEKNSVFFDKIIPGKWLLFTLNPKECGSACQNSLHEMRQIHIATNADQNRVVTAVLSFENPRQDRALNLLLAKEYPNTYSLTTDAGQFKFITNKSIKHNYALLEGAIYIADPTCHVILVYAPGTNPEHIYKDLHHLLQVSQIG